MSKAQLVITAITVEKRPVSEAARSYGASAPTASTPPGSSPSATTASSTPSASAAPTPEPGVLLLVQNLHIRVINAGTGELPREPTLNPHRDYQPTGKQPGWPKKNTANPT